VPTLVADVTSVTTTGKTVGEHALSAGTQKDCNILEGMLRVSRNICEEPGSPSTDNDFKGLVRRAP
jgi:hypothetical protein